MKSSERVKRALSHEQPDQVPFQDRLWPSTVERWRNEGLPTDTGPAEHLGWEIVLFGPDVSPQCVPRCYLFLSAPL